MDSLTFAVVALVFVLTARRGRGYALAAGAFLLPYNQYLPPSGIPFVNIQSMVMLGAAYEAVRSSHGESPERERGAFPPIGLLLLVGFILVGYLQTLMSDDPLKEIRWIFNPEAAQDRLIEYLYLIWLGIAGYLSGRHADVLRRVFWGAAAIIALEGTFCLLEMFVLGGTVSGHLEARNVSGAFLAIYASFVIGAYLAYRGMPRRHWFLVLSLVAAIPSLGTRSRGAVVALGTAAAVVTLLRNRVLFVVLIVLALTYQAWMPASMLARFEEGVEVEDLGNLKVANSAAQRLEYWKAGFRALAAHPLGVGLGMFPVTVPQYGLIGELKGYVFKNAHNSFVMFLVEFGIPAFLVLVFTFLRFAIRAIAVLRNDEDPFVRVVAFAALTGLIAMSAASVFGNYFFRLDVSGILWIHMGMLARRAVVLSPAAQRVEPAVVAGV